MSALNTLKNEAITLARDVAPGVVTELRKYANKKINSNHFLTGAGMTAISSYIVGTMPESPAQKILLSYYNSFDNAIENNESNITVNNNIIYYPRNGLYPKPLILFYLNNSNDSTSVKSIVIDYALFQYPNIVDEIPSFFIEDRVNKVVYKYLMIAIIIMFVVMLMAVFYLMGKTASFSPRDRKYGTTHSPYSNSIYSSPFTSSSNYPSLTSYHIN